MIKEYIKTPIGKTLCTLILVVLLIEGLGLAHCGGIIGFLAQSILFPIGLAIGLSFTIAVMVAIFFAVVFMVNKELAQQFWKELKQKCPCCSCQ